MNFYLYLTAAYLTGGIPFALLVGYASGHGDIRRQGSGNVGATNVWRVAGPKAAVFVFIGDIGKGVAAVMFCRLLYQPSWPIPVSAAALAAGIIAVLGHSFSPYLKFRGGKGVNTALGVFASLMPLETLIAFVVFVVVVAVFRYISLGSMSAAVSLAAVVWIERLCGRAIDDLYVAAATLMMVLILITHRANLKRLVTGTENRFQLRKASP